MPAQWIISKNKNRFDVYWRSNKPSDSQTNNELTKCNTDNTYSKKACLDYILSYVKPSDIIIDEGIPFVFLKLAGA